MENELIDPEKYAEGLKNAKVNNKEKMKKIVFVCRL